MAAPAADPLDPGRAAPAVGFVGLGQMGAPMASHLVGWPGGLLACDARAAATGPLVAAGAAEAPSPRALAERAYAAAGEARRLAEAAGIDLGRWPRSSATPTPCSAGRRR
jgi:3-hydroxyisobutyrate dehydrogenase-like beta-hydroxyacid dehydrogenase